MTTKNPFKPVEERLLIEMMVGQARNCLENIHAGIGPRSETGDYSDVYVVTPYGNIPWNKLSRISDEEMGPLKDDMRKRMKSSLKLFLEEKDKFFKELKRREQVIEFKYK